MTEQQSMRDQLTLPPPDLPDRPRRRRRRFLALGLAAVLVVGVVAGGVFYNSWKHERDRESRIETVAWSPDGRYLALGNGYGKTKVVTADERTAVAEDASGTTSIGRTIAWAPNSSRLASPIWNKQSPEAVFWDSSFVELGRTAANADPPSVAWSPNGKWIALGHGEALKVVAAAVPFDEQATIELGWIPDAVAWSGDSSFISAFSRGDMDTTEPQLHIEAVKSPRSGPGGRPEFFHETVNGPSGLRGDVTGVDWSPLEASALAVATDGDAQNNALLTVYGKGTFEEMASYSLGDMFGPRSVTWAPNGRLLAFAHDGDVHVMNGSRSLTEVGIFTGHRGAGGGSEIASISWAPDSDSIASVQPSDAVRIWDISTFKQVGDPIEW